MGKSIEEDTIWHDERGNVGRTCASIRQRRRTLEALCVLSWFLMDGCWLLGWAPGAYAFAAPAFVVALALAGLAHGPALLVALIDVAWLAMNASWAIGDLAGVPGAVVVAKWCFVVGVALCVMAYLAMGHLPILGRVRMLRFLTDPRPSAHAAVPSRKENV